MEVVVGSEEAGEGSRVLREGREGNQGVAEVGGRPWYSFASARTRGNDL